MGRPRGISYSVPVCQCTHEQIIHFESIYGVEGHGGCAVQYCLCDKFTWTPKKALITAKSSPVGQPQPHIPDFGEIVNPVLFCANDPNEELAEKARWKFTDVEAKRLLELAKEL